ncbi:Hypothetical protein A7982_11525 [Minicystis rosea]|nr:Hypothetical protein A7982_11525 [Minicystis rosea]
MSDDEDFEDEDGGDEEGGDDGDGDDGGFDDETAGRLVAGRAFELSGITKRQLVAFRDAVAGIGAKAGLTLVVVPGGDFTDTGPGMDEGVYGGCAVGLPAGSGGSYEPDVIERERALSQLAKAKDLTDAAWREIAALLPEREGETLRDAETGIQLVCVGPLAAATLAFGIEGSEDDEGKPGTYFTGQDMSQDRFATGVWGVRVGYTQYESPEVEEVDLSDEAHQKRVAELGQDNPAYFLIAQYD